MFSMTVIRISTMLLATVLFCWTATGFSPLSISSNNNNNNNQPISFSSTATTSPSSSSRLYAQGLKKASGFGGGGESKKKSGFGGKNKNENKDNDGKLKPMQQWNRYKDLKSEPKILVGVRIIGDDDNKDWLEVGRIKSKESKYTEMAVFRQRAIIAEHSKRLYPGSVTSKKTIEWGYFSDDDDKWKAVDKSSINDEVEGLEKLVGFVGIADPGTGYYCHYDDGRLRVGEETSYDINAQQKPRK